MIGFGRAFHRLSSAEQDYLNALHVKLNRAERQVKLARKEKRSKEQIAELGDQAEDIKGYLVGEQLRIMTSPRPVGLKRVNPLPPDTRLKEADAELHARLVEHLRAAKELYSQHAVESDGPEARHAAADIKDAERRLAVAENRLGITKASMPGRGKPVDNPVPDGRRMSARFGGEIHGSRDPVRLGETGRPYVGTRRQRPAPEKGSKRRARPTLASLMKKALT